MEFWGSSKKDEGTRDFGKIPRAGGAVCHDPSSHPLLGKPASKFWWNIFSCHPQMLHLGQILGTSLQYLMMSRRGRKSSFAPFHLQLFIVKEIDMP